MNRLMLASALALGLIGCGGSSSNTETAHETASTGGEMHHAEENHEQAATQTSATGVAPGQATIGDTTTCPVSGETFVVTAESPHVEHDGLTYYFCCAGCDARFAADPHQYLTSHEG